MSCTNVGSANPDIAGLGVILSFTIQAGFSFGLSLWSVVLRPPNRSRRRSVTVEQANQPESMSTALTCVRALSNFTEVFNPITLLSALISKDSSNLQPAQISDLKLKSDLIDQVLKTISDIQTLNGISLLIGAITQNETMNLYHYHIVYDTVNLTGVSMAASLAIVFKKPNAFAIRIPSIFVFLSLYLAFVILFGLKLQLWDDDVTGRCYRVDGISTRDAAHPYVDTIYLAITALYLFASLTACFGSSIAGLQKFIQALRNLVESDPRLRSWIRELKLLDLYLHAPSPNPFSKDGLLSLVQTGNTAAQLLDFLPDPSVTVLTVALVQYPVHVYTLFTLRKSNEPYLFGDSEDQWGLGQVVALVLVASTLLVCLQAIIEYVFRKWERQHLEASGDKEAWLSLFRVFLFDQEEEQGLSVSKEHSHLCGNCALPANTKHQ
ncbi:hypothetical protein GGR58DRAFT_509347 [Xylaria digitata]|nr:hypothetical protein GGR58DRAFT_509347 [Xylaria digitata]